MVEGHPLLFSILSVTLVSLLCMYLVCCCSATAVLDRKLKLKTHFQGWEIHVDAHVYRNVRTLSMYLNGCNYSPDVDMKYER